VKVALALAAAILVAGCHAADPCAGKSGACLTVEATGGGIGPLDQLVVTVTDGSGATQTGGTGVVLPRITLPVQFAALLRDGTAGPVTVDVVGRAGGGAVAEGAASVVLPASGHAKVTVSLSTSGIGGGDDMAGGGGDGGDDGGVVNGNVTLAPFAVDIGRVLSGDTGTAMFTVSATGDVTLGAAMLSPARAGLTISTASTCANMQMLHAGDSCRIVVSYAPTGNGASVATRLSLPTDVGTLTADVSARSPGAIAETLALGSPPGFLAVFAVSGRVAYAVGTPNAVWRRDAINGWQARTGPGKGSDNLTGIWAASDTDVYIADAQSDLVFHSSDRGMTWTSLDVGLGLQAVSVTGSDANTVYVGGNAGDILVGSAAQAPWTSDHNTDSIVWTQLNAVNGVVFGTRATEVDIRAGASSWPLALDESSMANLNAAWGASATDFYAVGKKTSCTTTGTCGVIFHKVGSNPAVTSTVAGCDGFDGVYGSPSGVVWVAGQGGVIASNANGSFTLATTATAHLHGIHGADGEIYAVGDGGVIMHVVE